jgi:hypothetical protein
MASDARPPGIARLDLSTMKALALMPRDLAVRAKGRSGNVLAIIANPHKLSVLYSTDSGLHLRILSGEQRCDAVCVAIEESTGTSDRLSSPSDSGQRMAGSADVRSEESS